MDARPEKGANAIWRDDVCLCSYFYDLNIRSNCLILWLEKCWPWKMICRKVRCKATSQVTFKRQLHIHIFTTFTPLYSRMILSSPDLRSKNLHRPPVLCSYLVYSDTPSAPAAPSVFHKSTVKPWHVSLVSCHPSGNHRTLATRGSPYLVAGK